MRKMARLMTITLSLLWFVRGITVLAEDLERAVPPKPVGPHLSLAETQEMSTGCVDCHTQSDSRTMHENPGVNMGCAHCHGGDPIVRATGLPNSPEYDEAKRKAHILPLYPQYWPSSANPERSYVNLLKESAEFVKFINPGDLRVADESCGGCHAKIVIAVKKSLMTTSAMLWGGASYNNNILPYKSYVLGESYHRQGGAQSII